MVTLIRWSRLWYAGPQTARGFGGTLSVWFSLVDLRTHFRKKVHALLIGSTRAFRRGTRAQNGVCRLRDPIVFCALCRTGAPSSLSRLSKIVAPKGLGRSGFRLRTSPHYSLAKGGGGASPNTPKVDLAQYFQGFKKSKIVFSSLLNCDFVDLGSRARAWTGYYWVYL